MSDDQTPTTFGVENEPADPGPDAFVGAFALLTDGSRYVAMRSDDGIDLIRADRLEGETYRESLLREIGWRLDLDPKRDVVCSGVPRAHLNSRLCGKGGGEPKWYVCQFYVAHLYGKRWRDKLDARDDLAWLTGDELMTGGTAAAKLPSDVQELLQIADLIPPDER